MNNGVNWSTKLELSMIKRTWAEGEKNLSKNEDEGFGFVDGKYVINFKNLKNFDLV